MVFHGRLSDSKSPQVSKTLLSILADLKNAVVWIVSSRSLISKSSSSSTNPLVTVLCASITIGITVTFMFHIFFISLVRSSTYLSFCFLSMVSQNSKVTIQQLLFFLLTITRSGHLAEFRWSVCILKFQRSFMLLIFLDRFLVVQILFVCMIKFKLHTQIPVDYLPHPGISGLILSLHKLSAFAYNVIDYLVSFTT